MENITAQVYALAESADDKTHRELVDTLRHLLYAIERPVETAERLIFGVSIISTDKLLPPSLH